MTAVRRAIFIAAIFICVSRIYAQSEPAVEVHDSTLVDTSFSSFVLTPDSSETESTSPTKRWYYPIGIMVLSGAAFFSLYFVRSR